MVQARNAARVGAAVAKWSEAAAFALGILAVGGMLAIGIARTHQSHANLGSPANFFDDQASTDNRS